MKPDFNTESTADLEATKRYIWRFLGERFRFFVVGFLLIGVGFVGRFIWDDAVNSAREHTPINGIGEAKRDMESTGVVIIVLVAYVFGITGSVLIIFQLVKCLLGPRRSPEEPTESIRYYLETCLLSDTLLGPLSVNSYICLLSCAKQEFGSYKDFKKYWRDVNKSIRAENAASDIQHLTQTTFRAVSANESSGRFGVWVKLIFWRTDNNVRREHSRQYYAEYEVARVGNRWYLSSGKWIGKRCD